MKTIGERLREERERLGLSQADCGQAGGVQKQAQLNYEADRRHPDALYLAGVSKAGIDVLYVVLGKRSPGTTALPLEQAKLLADYDALRPADRELVSSVIRGLTRRRSR